MIVKRDLLFGALAVVQKAVTEEQLQECLKLQREQNFYKSIGTILLEKGYTDREEIRRLLRFQEEGLKEAAGFDSVASGETLFGTIAVMKRLTTLERVEECLNEQRRLRRLGIYLRLGEIFVSKKHLTLEQVKMVLKRQNTRVLWCSRCSKRFNVTAFSSRRRFFCNVCGAELVEPEVLESISVDDRIEG